MNSGFGYSRRSVVAPLESVQNNIRAWCACVRRGDLVTPYEFQRFSVGCDK